MLVGISFAILTLLVCSILRFYSYPHPKFPRGYIGIPFVGFLVHFISGKNYTAKLVEMKRKYGNVCLVQMGSFKCVWLNDYEVIREAWSSPLFSGRPLIDGILERTRGVRGGIIFNDGEDFVEQQKFLLKSLKECGFGGKDMESVILTEAFELITKLKMTAGQPISTCHRFNVAALNVIWTITSGRRYELDDPELVNLTTILDRNMELNDGVKAAFFMPWLAKYFPSLIGWKTYLEESQKIFQFWEKVANDRIRLFQTVKIPKEEISGNFIDMYIQHINETTDPKSSFFGDRGVKSLALTLQDLFIASVETTATTISWALLYLATFPNVQKAVTKEIDLVLGLGHQRVHPKLTDRERMPYLNAFLLETMRFGTLAPLGMMHRAVEDVNFHGHFIPKDTIVQSNITAVHMDKELWGDPDNFRPTRFLSADGKSVKSFNYFLPFGHGKRKCVGETLAKQELFLFISAIMQEFEIKLDPNQPRPSLQPKVGVSAVPQPHKLIFERRGE